MRTKVKQRAHTGVAVPERPSTPVAPVDQVLTDKSGKPLTPERAEKRRRRLERLARRLTHEESIVEARKASREDRRRVNVQARADREAEKAADEQRRAVQFADILNPPGPTDAPDAVVRGPTQAVQLVDLGHTLFMRQFEFTLDEERTEVLVADDPEFTVDTSGRKLGRAGWWRVYAPSRKRWLLVPKDVLRKRKEE